ncbi:related to DNA topoisomerase II binding protein [Sporisorium reilianum SRZ2]|uniref:Related to DNA topoisomerase II binding protein n=1 Tax=Sporisorium reilianum (strain SRZ2) TaxID=999809 RepID=E6ZK39_SPORE|nr:related to DNA topoisomerase II binding protein [Sporisorium reilianum SRZ2]
MNRSARAHRSTKIPNVKLRPAQRDSAATSAKRSRQHDELLDDREDAAHFRRLRDDGRDHGAHLDSDFIGSSARPLKGAIISITGLGDTKATLTQYARELGARVEGNLTEDVTHLIADRPGSEKYRFALELGMHIVSPDWILEVRQAWLAGEDVDAEQLEHQHQLPALSNTTICFSALAGAQRRTLVALATELGATVSDELRFDGTITHLVSASADPNASSSVHHLLHFLDRARHGRNGTREQAASRILAVRPEWLQDCQRAAGCLSEQIYSIFAKLPDQKERSALVEKAQTKLPSPFVRQQDPVAVAFQGPFVASNRSQLALIESDSGTRNSRNTDASHALDEDDEQPITLGSRQKAAAAAEKSFDNILSQLKSNQPSSKPTTRAPAIPLASDAPVTSTSSASASTSPNAPPSALPSAPTSTSAPFNTHRKSLLGMSRASSFSPAPAPSATSTAAPLNMRKTSSKLITLPHSSQATATQSSNHSPSQPCFHTKSFKVCLNDEHRKKVLEQVLRDNGATLLHVSLATSPDFVVVEPKASPASIRALDDAHVVPVLHFWIEYCLHHETFVEPHEYFAALPARVPLPLHDGGQLRLLLLGFDPDSPELYHAQKLVAEMGGSVAKQIKGESLTHVICATQESFDGRRAQRARSCGVPVVGLEFIIKARQTGRLVPPPIAIAIPEQSSSALTPSSNSNSNSTALNSNAAAVPATEHHEQAGSVAKQPDLPLAGCTVSRSKVLASQSVMLERKALQLGACWQAQANESTTHLLHRGAGLPREAKDLESGAFLVHPTWLDKCIEQAIRVDEGLFPSSMDPSRSLLTVLSNSDGSATGNFLSQASQSTMQRKAKPQAAQASQQQTQAELVAAAKPWHRSISADAARRTIDVDPIDGDGPGNAPRSRGRSEEIETVHDVLQDDETNELVRDVDFDADVTLSGHAPDSHLGMDVDDAAPAPSSQTLFEGEEAVDDDAPVGEVRGTNPSAPFKQVDLLKKAKDQIASADEVMELLRSRTLAQGARKKNRLPPRARKQRPDEIKSTATSGTEGGMLAPEKVLEAQAQLDAQRAAEAAAQGYSLGMDKDVALPPNSQTGAGFDASIRIVYDDPAALRERNKLLKMLDHHQQQQQQHHQPARGMDDTVAIDAGDETEDIQMDDSVGGAAQANGSRKRGSEDTFGAGRQSRHYWENRNSESPTKRPVVRRQPLARR